MVEHITAVLIIENGSFAILPMVSQVVITQKNVGLELGEILKEILYGLYC